MDYIKKNTIKKMYYKARLPKEQKLSIDKVFANESCIFDAQKVGYNAIINATNKEYIQNGINCEGKIYYLVNDEIIKIEYEVDFSDKHIIVYMDGMEDGSEDRLIIQHYLDIFIKALAEAHVGSFECEMIHSPKPEKLIMKDIKVKKEHNSNYNGRMKTDNTVIKKETESSDFSSLEEKAKNMKAMSTEYKDVDNLKNGENKMISLAKIYNEIEMQPGENVTLDLRVYFESNKFGTIIESDKGIIADIIIAEKEYYARKEKIRCVVSAFDTVEFIENQVSKMVDKEVKFRKFFVVDQEIDEHIGCPNGYIGYFNKNGSYIEMK